MSKTDTLLRRLDRESAEVEKTCREIQEVLDLAASRGVYFELKGFPISKTNGAGNAANSPSRTSGPSESMEESQ